MTRPITLILFFALIGFRNISIALDELTSAEAKGSKKDTKAYVITSLDGKRQKVIVMPDYVNRVLKIICLNDTVRIGHYWDVPPEAHMLGNNFIKVDYEVRGGSNLGLGNTMILCVNHNKLYITMHSLRYSKWEDGRAYMYYNVKLGLVGNSKNGYKLKAAIKDTVFSKETPSDNYGYNNISILHFDSDQKVFYSIKQSISGFILHDERNKPTHKEIVRGNFPIILLGPEKYYFVNGKWYQVKDNFELSEFE